MIPTTTFAGRTVAVFGLARSGLAAAAALIEGGATVWAWDDGEAAIETGVSSKVGEIIFRGKPACS